MSERRRRPRARADFDVALRAGQDMVEAAARDISELGIRVRTRHKLPMRQKLALDLALPGHAMLESIAGQVVRCWPENPTGRDHLVAIAFTDVPPLARAAILGFVKKGHRV